MSHINDRYEEQYREIKREYNRLLANIRKLYYKNKILHRQRQQDKNNYGTF